MTSKSEQTIQRLNEFIENIIWFRDEAFNYSTRTATDADIQRIFDIFLVAKALTEFAAEVVAARVGIRHETNKDSN